MAGRVPRVAPSGTVTYCTATYPLQLRFVTGFILSLNSSIPRTAHTESWNPAENKLNGLAANITITATIRALMLSGLRPMMRQMINTVNIMHALTIESDIPTIAAYSHRSKSMIK